MTRDDDDGLAGTAVALGRQCSEAAGTARQGADRQQQRRRPPHVVVALALGTDLGGNATAVAGFSNLTVCEVDTASLSMLTDWYAIAGSRARTVGSRLPERPCAEVRTRSVRRAEDRAEHTQPENHHRGPTSRPSGPSAEKGTKEVSIRWSQAILHGWGASWALSGPVQGGGSEPKPETARQRTDAVEAIRRHCGGT